MLLQIIRFHSFLWPSSISLYICSTAFLSTHLLRDTWVASISWLLYIILQWTQGCIYSFKLVFWVSLAISQKQSLGHNKAVPLLIFGKPLYCFPLWVHQSAFPPAMPEGSFSLHPCHLSLSRVKMCLTTTCWKLPGLCRIQRVKAELLCCWLADPSVWVYFFIYKMRMTMVMVTFVLSTLRVLEMLK